MRLLFKIKNLKTIIMLVSAIIIAQFQQQAYGWEYWEKQLQMARPNEDGIFEFDLTIQHGMTMTTMGKDGMPITAMDKAATGGPTPIIDYSPDNLCWTKRDPDFHSQCSRNETFLNGTQRIDEMDQLLATLVQYDGKHRKVITINGKSPGDPIVVPLGAKVVIRLRNHLLTQAITLHIHGMTMQNRWWNDGVPFIQQCPITPGSVYTYNFIADTPGTHFYHGHMMGDRSMGFLGGFIVIRPDEKIQFTTEFGNQMKIGRQNFAILQDWSPDSVEDEWQDFIHERIKWLGYRIDSDECIQPETAGPPRAHGPYLGFLRQFSVLVNQKGWHSQTDLRRCPSQLPLANFAIKRGENLLLRLANGGFEQSFYVWIEEHEFWVVAVDGSYVKPRQFDSLLINPGERYDLVIVAQTNPTRDVFHIIFESLDRFMGNMSTGEDRTNVGLANLIYANEWAPFAKNLSSDVDWKHKKCTNELHCLILNCPLPEFITRPRNYTCIPIDHLENAEMPSTDDAIVFDLSPNNSSHQFHELMLNAMPAFNRWFYKMPREIPFFYQGPLERIAVKCDQAKCNRSTEQCQCFHHYEFALDSIVQITVATNMNMLHPLHLHGTKFYVMKMGTMEPEYKLNSDVECAEDDCVEMKWSNISHYNGNVPQLKKNPILRDTVIVPNKGYVVIRFRATNPGWFFAHCHVLFHHLNGMAFVYKVDATSGQSKIPKPPANFPNNCAFFDGGGDDGWAEEEKDDPAEEAQNAQFAGTKNDGKMLMICILILVFLRFYVVH